MTGVASGRADLLAEARSWIGTPFHHQGRLKAVGCDCIGLVIGVARALGHAVAEPPAYPRRPDGRSLREGLARHLAETDLARALPGDVILFRIGRAPQHVGILAEAGRLIHAYSGIGRVVEMPLSDWWWSRALAAFRFPAGA